jgi:hypothetical protein
VLDELERGKRKLHRLQPDGYRQLRPRGARLAVRAIRSRVGIASGEPQR